MDNMSPPLTPKPISGGLIVVFEGIDGVGKTTQLLLAKDVLLADGWPVYITRNLGGTPIGEELRKVMLAPIERPTTTNLYLSVAIQEALVGAIEAERANGKLIFMDRGPLSLAAYEIYGGGLNETLGWQHVDAGMQQIRPELTIIYTADIKTALRRAHRKVRKADYFESKPPGFFERVAKGYTAAASRYPYETVTIDAGQPVEAVHAQTTRAIQQALDKKFKVS
jgi:dTMP kinase